VERKARLMAEHAAGGVLEVDHHLDGFAQALALCRRIPHIGPKAPILIGPRDCAQTAGVVPASAHGAYSGAEKFASVHGHDRSPVKQYTPAGTISEHRCSRKTTPGRCIHFVCATPLCDGTFAPR